MKTVKTMKEKKTRKKQKTVKPPCTLSGMERERPRYFPDDADIPDVQPFTPGFGSTPPCLVGRDELIRDVCAHLARDPSGEGTANVLLAPRGLGKTVVLNEIEDAARAERGWLVLSVSGTDGDPLIETHKQVLQAQASLEQAHGQPTNNPISGISFGAGGFSAGVSFKETSDQRRTRYGDDLRRDLTELADAADQIGSRVLLTMDEMHAIPLAKARKFGSYIQHIAKRERKALVYVGAALPYITETLLADRKSTFLQRLAVHSLDLLSNPDTRRGLQEPIREHGGRIGGDALDIACSAVAGHPYMLQLVGDRMWSAAGGAGKQITVNHAKAAVSQARETLEDQLFTPTWHNLSDTDKRFAGAMAVLSERDQSPRVVAICEEAGINMTSANTYRRRQLLSGMVSPAGRGRLKFAHPSIGPWLRRTIARGSVRIPEAPLPGI